MCVVCLGILTKAGIHQKHAEDDLCALCCGVGVGSSLPDGVLRTTSIITVSMLSAVQKVSL